MKQKINFKALIVFFIFLMVLLSFNVIKAENDGFNYIKEGAISELTENQKQELEKINEQQKSERMILNSNNKTNTISQDTEHIITPSEVDFDDFKVFTIYSDETSIYLASKTGVEKFSLATKTKEQILNYETSDDNYPVYCVEGNVIYIMVNSTSSAQIYHIQGYDLTQKTKVFDREFKVDAEDEKYKMEQFVVDGNQNFYFKTAKRVIASYDKEGDILDKATNPADEEIFIKQITPDGKTLIYATNVENSEYTKSGYVSVENGKFLRYMGDKITVYEDIPFWVSTNYNSTLKFNKECTFAFDTLGHIFKYSFEYEDGFRKTNLTFVEDAYSNLYYSINEAGCFYNGNVYVYGGLNNQIIEYNLESGKTTGIYKVPVEDIDVKALGANEGKLYIIYENSYNAQDRNVLEIELKSAIQKAQEIVIDTHTAYNHTKEQIIQKFEEAKPKAEYNSVDSLFETIPVTTLPYKEGILKEQVKQDTLNKLNFYRWLYGLNNVTINESRMYKNSRAALTINLNGKLSYTPERPAGMTNEFYKDATEGAGSGENYTGNIYYGKYIPYTIVGYINNTAPLSISEGLNNRNSMLNLYANQISFGECGLYSTVSVYTTDEDLGNNEKFYAYPTPGYFPVEELEISKDNEINKEMDTRWSITIPASVYKIDKNKLKLKLIYNGEKYYIGSFEYDSADRTIYYYLPKELKAQLTQGTNGILPGNKVEVELNGLQDNNYNSVTIKYWTEFFSTNPKEVTDLEVFFNGLSTQTQSDGKQICKAKQGQEMKVTVNTLPNDAPDRRYVIEIENEDLARYDEETKMIRFLRPGKTNLYAKRKSDGKILTTVELNISEATYCVNYRTHVQNIGWQSWMTNGEVSGTSGKEYRLEGIQINVNGLDVSGGVEYKTHVQNEGWQDWKQNGEVSGTQGKSYRLEGISIRLTGQAATKYDIYYRVHAQNFGWMGWAKNGEMAGTEGYSYRLEAIQIKLIEKGKMAPGDTSNAFRKAPPSVIYSTHVQEIGWQADVKDNEVSGTSGLGYRLEGIRINLGNSKGGGIEYRTHVQNEGWQDWKQNGQTSGSTGKSYRLEAIQIKLTGKMAEQYDIYYRVHSQEFGWMGWAKNGQIAGTSGYSYRLEAIQIVLVEKGKAAPGDTTNAYKAK